MMKDEKIPFYVCLPQGKKLGLTICRKAVDEGKMRITVRGIADDSPAAGKLLADDIITHFNGEEVSHMNCQDLATKIAQADPSSPSYFTIHRNCEKLQDKLPHWAKKRNAFRNNKSKQIRVRGKLGVTLLRETGTFTLFLTAVSKASQLVGRVSVGDVITHFNGVCLYGVNAEDFRKILAHSIKDSKTSSNVLTVVPTGMSESDFVGQGQKNETASHTKPKSQVLVQQDTSSRSHQQSGSRIVDEEIITKKRKIGPATEIIDLTGDSSLDGDDDTSRNVKNDPDASNSEELRQSDEGKVHENFRPEGDEEVHDSEPHCQASVNKDAKADASKAKKRRITSMQNTSRVEQYGTNNSNHSVCTTVTMPLSPNQSAASSRAHNDCQASVHKDTKADGNMAKKKKIATQNTSQTEIDSNSTDCTLKTTIMPLSSNRSAVLPQVSPISVNNKNDAPGLTTSSITALPATTQTHTGNTTVVDVSKKGVMRKVKFKKDSDLGLLLIKNKRFKGFIINEVKPKSPLIGKVSKGEVITHINGQSLYGLKIADISTMIKKKEIYSEVELIITNALNARLTDDDVTIKEEELKPSSRISSNSQRARNGISGTMDGRDLNLGQKEPGNKASSTSLIAKNEDTMMDRNDAKHKELAVHMIPNTDDQSMLSNVSAERKVSQSSQSLSDVENSNSHTLSSGRSDSIQKHNNNDQCSTVGVPPRKDPNAQSSQSKSTISENENLKSHTATISSGQSENRRAPNSNPSYLSKRSIVPQNMNKMNDTTINGSNREQNMTSQTAVVPQHPAVQPPSHTLAHSSYPRHEQSLSSKDTNAQPLDAQFRHSDEQFPASLFGSSMTMPPRQSIGTHHGRQKTPSLHSRSLIHQLGRMMQPGSPKMTSHAEINHRENNIPPSLNSPPSSSGDKRKDSTTADDVHPHPTSTPTEVNTSDQRKISSNKDGNSNGKEHDNDDENKAAVDMFDRVVACARSELSKILQNKSKNDGFRSKEDAARKKKLKRTLRSLKEEKMGNRHVDCILDVTDSGKDLSVIDGQACLELVMDYLSDDDE